MLRICSSWREGCQRAGLEDRGDAIDRVAGSATWTEINQQYQLGGMDVELFCRAFSELLDDLYAPRELRQLIDAWVYAEYDGAAALIESLAPRAVTTCALSNTCAEHWDLFRAWPAMQAFDHCFASHEIGHIKPDPEAFAHVENTLQVRPSEIIFFDDTQENVEAAIARGWQAHRVDPGNDPVADVRRVLDALALA